MSDSKFVRKNVLNISLLNYIAEVVTFFLELLQFFEILSPTYPRVW